MTVDAALALPGCVHAPASLSTHELVPAMKTRPLMAVRLTIGSVQKVGAVPGGDRIIFPVIGGTFDGPRLRGEVLPGGADWALRRPDGVMEIDLRITLKADDGALINMAFQGVRHGPPEVIAALERGEPVDPSSYYFRSVAQFETAAPRHAFLNTLLAVGNGELRDGKPTHTFEEIL
ncbi:DUF3237 domain-containing protein [Myxococcaceae bacterium GXIMD 01537]